MRPGDHVHVPSLGKGIVREVRNGGRCVVEIKGRTMLVDRSQLAPIDPPKRHAAQTVPPTTELPTRADAAATIDLHGMTTDEAVVAIDVFLNDAILAGLAEVRVIHGRSGGRLKSTVHKRLQGVSAVRGYRLDPANPGVTIVQL